MKNNVQLITYVDRLTDGNIRALQDLLTGSLAGVFGGVHLLPFFYAIDGADAGFDPIDHAQVDPRLGDWQDIKALTTHIDVMADVIVNHMSSESPQFRDYVEHGASSEYANLFLTVDRVFPAGATDADWRALYRPRPGLPVTTIKLKSGEQKKLWTTFTPQQIDIDVRHRAGEAYLSNILQTFAGSGVAMIRLDAVGYAIKKAGTSCFMMPETFDFLRETANKAKLLGIEVLVEIHSYYRTQIEVAKQVDWVYDFALPPLVLHAFFFKTAHYLKEWIRIRPNNALTVLDTHDGIGVIDIGADATDRKARPGLVPDNELAMMVDRIHDNSRGESRAATGAAASNLDLYQINCTYYAALAYNDLAYLLARAIQFFIPGVPQVYYVGLLAGENDMPRLQATGVGRDINRHHYRGNEVELALGKPVVKDLLALIHLRNDHDAFNGKMTLLESQAETLRIRWQHGDAMAELTVDFSNLHYEIRHTTDASAGEKKMIFVHISAPPA